MHLAQRAAAVVLSLGLATSLVGCGFHLKNSQPSTTTVAYQKMNLVLPANTSKFNEKLSLYLGAAGVQLSDDNDAYVLRVLEYKPQRLELNGKLVEVLLRLNVTFRIEDAKGQPLTEPRTLVASRTYQYDVVTVNTDDQEEKFLNEVLVDDMAQQVVRQIASNRLPKAQP